jgi:hypothetical protein
MLNQQERFELRLKLRSFTEAAGLRRTMSMIRTEPTDSIYEIIVQKAGKISEPRYMNDDKKHE